MGNSGSLPGAVLVRAGVWGEREEAAAEGGRLESGGVGRDGERGKPLGFLASCADGRLSSWNACRGKRSLFLCVLN